MNTYTAVATRTEGVWHVDVPDVGRSTQARALKDVERMARELVAIMLDVSVDSFDVDIHFTLPAAAQDHLRRAEKAREAEESARTEAAREWRAAATCLRHEGLSIREIGKLLHVSHQRVAQLIIEPDDELCRT